jgi:looped-hinge helix DNA binding domain, AbrB family
MKIMERGQITIPKKIRDRYGLKPDTELDILPVEEGILIVKRSAQKSPIRDVYGILRKNRNSDGFIEEIRGR